MMDSNMAKFFRFRFGQRFLSPTNLLLSLALLVILFATIAEHRDMLIEFRPYTERVQVGPDRWQNLAPDAVQQQVYMATNRLLRVMPEAEILAYFRTVAPFLAFLLPLIAFIFSYRNIAGDRESGRSLSLFTLPVARRDMVVGMLLGDLVSFALASLIMLTTLFVVFRYLVGTAADALLYLRVGLYLGAVWAYLLVFLLLGTLISSMSRTSTRSLILCLAAFLLIGGLSILKDGVPTAIFADYPILPRMCEAAQTGAGDMSFWGDKPPVFVREARPQWEEQRAAAFLFLDELHSYREAFQTFIEHRYRIERLLNFLSPANLHIEVASALLQDRFIPPYRIFAPVPLDETHATIGQSLRYLLPEILFTLAMIMLLFWLNVRALTKLEV